MSKFLFIIISSFITNCYRRDFTTFDLLRKPLEFKFERQGEFLVAKIPTGIPWEDSIIKLDNEFVTKVKDIPVRKGIQKIDDRTSGFVIDVSSIEKLLVFEKGEININQGILSYYPLYKFVTEPANFDLENDVSKFALRCIQYYIKSIGFKTESLKKFDDVSWMMDFGSSGSSKKAVITEGKTSLERIVLKSGHEASDLDIVNRRIRINSKHEKVCFSALATLGIRDLANIILKKQNGVVELTYEK